MKITRVRLALRLFAALLLAVLAVLGGPAAAQTQPPFNPAQQSEIEGIVKDYLLAHPEVLIEALQIAEARKVAEDEAARQQAILAHRDVLVNNPDSPSQGAADAPVVIVEFLDFRCGFCRKSHAVVTQLLAEDPGVRVIYRDFPILGPESVLASRAALAAHRQGRYVAMHDLFYETPLTLDEAGIMGAARDPGLDLGQFQEDINAPAIDAMLGRNHELDQALNIEGTPAFIISARLIPGYATIDQTRVAVAEERDRLSAPSA